jgi:hypothetical protein
MNPRTTSVTPASSARPSTARQDRDSLHTSRQFRPPTRPESIDGSTESSATVTTPRKSSKKLDTGVAEFRNAEPASAGRRPRKSRLPEISTAYNGVKDFRATRSTALSQAQHIENAELQELILPAAADEDPPPANITSDIPTRGRKRKPACTIDHEEDELAGNPAADSPTMPNPSAPPRKANAAIGEIKSILIPTAAFGLTRYDNISLRQDPGNLARWKAFEANGVELPPDFCPQKGRISQMKWEKNSQYLLIKRPRNPRLRMSEVVFFELLDATEVPVVVKALSSDTVEVIEERFVIL